MPHLAASNRLPLMDTVHTGLSAGSVRTVMPEIERLYHKLRLYQDVPASREGLFLLACLLKDRPLDETHAQMILHSAEETDDGSFSGSFSDQLATARTLLSVYEFAGDKAILKRLAQWCRWLETSWDSVENDRMIRIQPADLMEFLVRFFRHTGLKGVLRLCARVRSSSMDWTTILHQFHQRIPLDLPDMIGETEKLLCLGKQDNEEYLPAQLLSNHAEILADGFRYTAYAAMFSGNGQELSAGQKGWDSISKYHHAVCGGTTANIFLGGNRTNQGIHPASTAAWIEAMVSQMQISGGTWMISECSLLIFNALADCVRHIDDSGFRFVNTCTGPSSYRCADPESGPERDAAVLSRIARAVSAAYMYAVTQNRETLCINWILPGRYSVACGTQPFVIRMDDESAAVRCRKPFNMELRIFMSRNETAEPVLKNGGREEHADIPPENPDQNGVYIRISREWNNQDTLIMRQDGRFRLTDAYHHGKYIIVRNRLMVLDVHESGYSYSIAGSPVFRNGILLCPLRRITGWPNQKGIPADLPVLPAGSDDVIEAPLFPYAMTPCRISVFPTDLHYE